jgi:uncharacterized membrane protein
MFSFHQITIFLTILLSGLVAGLLYSYSCSVNIGLRALPDVEYLKAMQSINQAIQNPFFFVSFMGLLIMFPLSAWQLHSLPSPAPYYAILMAMGLYFIGVFGVTVFGNVPLNNYLAVFDISKATADELSVVRSTFEKPWNTYHFIRTISAIISFGLTIFSLLKYKS